METLLHRVAPDVRQRVERYRRPLPALQTLFGRLLLDAVLFWRGFRLTSSDLVLSENGKPYFVEGPSVSVAHSGEFVLCALVHQGAVGLDVEEKRFIAPDTLSAVWTEEERRELRQGSDTSTVLSRWTAKECLVKMTGEGFRFPLNRIDPGLLSVLNQFDCAALLQLQLEGNALASIATTFCVRRIEQVRFSVQQLLEFEGDFSRFKK